MFKSNDAQAIRQAVVDGIGVGFLLQHEVADNSELVELFPPLAEWKVTHWLVTHGDLHRSAKVQAFLQAVRAKTKCE